MAAKNGEIGRKCDGVNCKNVTKRKVYGKDSFTGNYLFVVNWKKNCCYRGNCRELDRFIATQRNTD